MTGRERMKTGSNDAKHVVVGYEGSRPTRLELLQVFSFFYYANMPVYLAICQSSSHNPPQHVQKSPNGHCHHLNTSQATLMRQTAAAAAGGAW